MFQSGGWGLETTYKGFSGISEQIKPLQLVGTAAEFKFESKFEPLPVIWQSLPKAIPESNRRFWLQIQWQLIGAALQHSLGGSDGRAAFPSRLQSMLAALGSLKEKRYHSCYTDLAWESKSFYAL